MGANSWTASIFSSCGPWLSTHHSASPHCRPPVFLIHAHASVCTYGTGIQVIRDCLNRRVSGKETTDEVADPDAEARSAVFEAFDMLETECTEKFIKEFAFTA